MGRAEQCLNRIDFTALIRAWTEHHYMTSGVADDDLSPFWSHLAEERLSLAADTMESQLCDAGFSSPGFLIACCQDPDDYDMLVWAMKFLETFRGAAKSASDPVALRELKLDLLEGLMPECVELFGEL